MLSRTAVSSWSPTRSEAVAVRAAPAEVALATAPALLFALWAVAAWETCTPLFVGVVAALWGLVRIARDGQLSRVTLTTLVAPLGSMLMVGAAAITVKIAETLGLSPAYAGFRVLVCGGLNLAMGGAAYALSRRLARRSPADARVLLYLQYFPVIAALGCLAADSLYPTAAVCLAYAAAAVRYVRGAVPAERVARQMRAGAATFTMIVLSAITLGFAHELRVVAVAWVLAALGPLFWSDRRLEQLRGPAAPDAPQLDE